MNFPFLVYVHNERCGGTTMHSLLRNHFPFYTTIKPRRWSNLPENGFSEKHLRKMLKLLPFCQGMGGHTIRPFYDYASVVGSQRKMFTFTFLRDPVKRYLSHFYYQKQVMNIPWRIEEFLDEKRFNDFQTVKIANIPDAGEAIKTIEQKIDFVGLSEQYDASLLLLFSRFGIRPNYQLRNALKHKEKNKGFEDFSAEIRERILENNRQDILLYEHVSQKIFPRYLASFKGDMESELARFREENRAYSYKKWKRLSGIVFKYINYYAIQPAVYR